jgi:ribosome biogenesis GTPase A
MDINWFPGHMAKTLRLMKDQLKLVDMVIETCDARIPESSRNPELDKLLGQKSRILVLNKADLADPAATKLWLDYYQSAGLQAVACESTNRRSLDPLRRQIIALNQHKIDKAKEKGRLIRPVKVMIAGIPNTGKSTLINSLSGRKTAIVADRPGVTRHISWSRADSELELLDTPGVLWPRLGNDKHKVNLAATGAIKDELLPVEEVATLCFYDLTNHYLDLLKSRYKLDDIESEDGELLSAEIILEQAARKRGCILSGGRIDQLRFSNLFLDDLRSGRIGRITLERPDN